MIGEKIQINGIVQGVGFRPTVWRLARDCGVVGQVLNNAEGVSIKAWGTRVSLDNFVTRINAEAPPLSRIDRLVRTSLEEQDEPPGDFQIVDSQGGDTRSGVTPDAATCSACLEEILDPSNRRYRYPFTNCTHCGPRLSIIRAIPYDRANTSMAPFSMCSQCQSEYEDPADRRFHAQPNACPECGPKIWLEDATGNCLEAEQGSDVIVTAAGLIRAGKILAIKGIGGFHLACDASNEEAVHRLRQRKRRFHKALALMAKDIEMVARFVKLNDVDNVTLSERTAPILILESAGEPLASEIAPGQNTLGIMLPYTPLQHLMMRELEQPMVMTSGNVSEEPQVIGNQEARQRLSQIADYFLLHDLDIVNRVDDSVLRPAADAPRFLRRARGYAPQPILLPQGFEGAGNVLAMGGELKSTFCLLKEAQAILSQHMGDLKDSRVYRDYQYNLELYRQLFDFTPDLIAVDMHPDYLSSQLGQMIARGEGVRLLEVQHHHAHVAACMAEHLLPLDSGPVLGVALDGLGYGGDGTIWGGEFLLADYLRFERVAHFQQVAMPGGIRAIHEPWRNTYAQLASCIGWDTIIDEYADLELIRFLSRKPIDTMNLIMEKGLNSPLTSSAGRLFDAVAAALGLCRDSVSFEGQAAIELEALATSHFADEVEGAYSFELQGGNLNWAKLWRAILRDLDHHITPGVIAARFHQGLALAIAETAGKLCHQYHIDRVVLSGGVFQNRLMLERTSQLLVDQHLSVMTPAHIPANDGGLSLGQAVIAMAAEMANSCDTIV